MKIISFHYYGRTKKGASKWVGTVNSMPKWFTWGFLGYGIGAGVVGVLSLLFQLWTGFRFGGVNVLTMVMGIHAVIFSLIGYIMERQRLRIESLTPVDEVCETLGVSEEELESLAEEKNIRPLYNINDRDYYDLSQFRDADILLRASEAPVEPETLLRPAEYAGETPAEQLLRPVEESETQSAFQWDASAEKAQVQQVRSES